MDNSAGPTDLKPKFVDWGFANILNSSEEAFELVKFIATNEYRLNLVTSHKFYEKDRLTDANYTKVIQQYFSRVQDHFNESPDPMRSQIFLKRYDMLCLVGGPIAILYKMTGKTIEDFESLIRSAI
jgi:hypothetical protein